MVSMAGSVKPRTILKRKQYQNIIYIKETQQIECVY